MKSSLSLSLSLALPSVLYFVIVPKLTSYFKWIERKKRTDEPESSEIRYKHTHMKESLTSFHWVRAHQICCCCCFFYSHILSKTMNEISISINVMCGQKGKQNGVAKFEAFEFFFANVTHYTHANLSHPHLLS